MIVHIVMQGHKLPCDLTVKHHNPMGTQATNYLNANTFIGMVGTSFSASRLCYCYYNALSNMVMVLPADKILTAGEIIYIECDYDNFVM